MFRRDFIAAGAALAGTGVLPSVWGQSWPVRPIKLIVPFIPGSAPDVMARGLSERLSQALGQPVVIDNKPGAGGNIGLDALAKSLADGYTIGLGTSSLSINPYLYRKVPYDPVNDFTPITLIDRLANVLLITPGLPVKNFAEFVKYVKENPGKLNYASSGNGSLAYLSMELLKAKLGLSITHIPYRGAGPALTDLQAGQVHMTWNNLSSNLSMAQNGRLRALAVASPIRAPQLPDVPTFDELKLPELNLTSWTGLAAPAKTPESIVAQLYEAMRTVLRDPQTQRAWNDRGAMLPDTVKPAEFRKEIQQRIGFYKNIVKTHKISVDQ